MAFASGQANGFAGRIDYSASGALTINGHAYTILSSLGAAGSTTGTDLQGMSGNLAGYYALGSNIDASATSGWNAGAGFLPVGTFTGVFEGLGHTVSNLTISRSGTDSVGLFGVTSGASVLVNDVGLSGGSVSGKQYTGALAGYNGGGTISNSYDTGNVTGNSGSANAGGLVGWNSSGTISNSYDTGPVSGGSAVGGLVGFNHSGTISNSYATGSVSGSGNFVAGLVGNNASSSTVSDSYATGNVTGSLAVGGLVGDNGVSSTVSNSYATGSVTGTQYVGGLVGYTPNSGSITNSYSAGAVSGTTNVGGLVGYDPTGTVTNSFWDTTTSGQAGSAGGTGMATADMRKLANFNSATAANGNSNPNWSIDSTYAGSGSTWYIISGATYPLLRNPAADMPSAFTWTGASSTAWSLGANWTGGAAPGSGSSPTILVATNAPVFSANTTLASLTMNSGSSLDLDGYTLSLTGTLTTTGATLSSSAGGLAIASDHYSFGSGTSITSSGAITLKEYTAGNSIGIGTNASGTVNLTDTELGYLNGGSYVFGDSNAGNVDINTASSIANKNLTIISGGTIYLDKSGDASPQALTDSGASNTTLTLEAGSNIVIAANTSITDSGTGKQNVVLDADTAGGGGYIYFTGNGGAKTVLATNGGDIYLGGGSLDGSGHPTGYATGSSAAGFGNGILVGGNDTINAAGGNITMQGQGGTSNLTNNGIQIISNATVQTSSTGTIAMTGYGGNGNDAALNTGVYSSGTIQADSGTVTITGTGGSSDDGHNSGVVTGTIQTGSGAIAITGTGGSGNLTTYGAINDGVDNMNHTISSTSGTITIAGTGGTGNGTGGGGGGYSTSNTGIWNGGSISTGGSGTITLTGTGGSGTNDDYTGGFLTYGQGNQGIYNDSAANGDWNGTIKTASGTLTITGVAGSGSGSLTTPIENLYQIGSNTQTGNIVLSANSLDLTDGGQGTVKTSGNVTLAPYTAATTIGVGTGAGTLAVNNATLGTLTDGTLTIGAGNAGAMDINSTFSFATPTSFVSGGDITVDHAITSTAGAGNALVLAGADFINTAGANPFSLTGGRWLIYSTAPGDNTLDGLALPTQVFSKTYAGYPPSSVTESGDVMFYSSLAPASSGSTNLPDSVAEQLAVGPAGATGGQPSQPGMIYADAALLYEFNLDPADPHRWWDGVVSGKRDQR